MATRVMSMGEFLHKHPELELGRERRPDRSERRGRREGAGPRPYLRRGGAEAAPAAPDAVPVQAVPVAPGYPVSPYGVPVQPVPMQPYGVPVQPVPMQPYGVPAQPAPTTPALAAPGAMPLPAPMPASETAMEGTRRWGPMTALGQNLTIRAAEGHRAMFFELRSGLYLVGSVTEAQVRSQFGLAVLTPLLIKAATTALTTPQGGGPSPAAQATQELTALAKDLTQTRPARKPEERWVEERRPADDDEWSGWAGPLLLAGWR